MLSRRGVLGALGAGLAGCSPLGFLDSVVRVDKGGMLLAANVAYGAEPLQAMDIYRPERPGPAPILIHVHGGSWSSGSRTENRYVGMAFAARGFVTVVPDYRKLPTHQYPTFIEDIALAIKAVRERAAEWDGNPDQIFISGHSAGGYTVAMLTLQEQWLAAVGLSRTVLRGAVSLAGAFEVFPFRNATMKAAFGQMPNPERAVPRLVAEPGGPMLYLLHGTSDTIVPISESLTLFNSLQAAGIKVGLATYPSVGHMGLVLALTRTFRYDLPVIHNMIWYFERNGATPLYSPPDANSGSTTPVSLVRIQPGG